MCDGPVPGRLPDAHNMAQEALVSAVGCYVRDSRNDRPCNYIMPAPGDYHVNNSLDSTRLSRRSNASNPH